LQPNIGERYTAFRKQVEEELRACGRKDSVTIVAVSKKQPTEAIAEAIRAGVTDIGENYVQEARKKLESLGTFRKHFIGHIQTNKAKAIVDMFDLVQSVDRLEAGEALARAARGAGKHIPVLVQVNISPAERFGVAPEAAERLADRLITLGNLSVEGIMAIGPVTSDRAEIQRAFALAAKTLERVGGSTLSIGMSGDWREAVRAGSTMIRIGTAIFGPRTAAPGD
jgi:pyridoxal phosphate enzyme (YggS family)